MNQKKQNYFSINSLIELQFENSHQRNIAYNSFLPEFGKVKTERSNISISKEENSIVFEINSTDITAYRASVNEIITFGKIVDNCLLLIENF
jgi:tRNA threonylcarbamoyladenosine modification (KEOPS) complex  Pcc1 subunit